MCIRFPTLAEMCTVESGNSKVGFVTIFFTNERFLLFRDLIYKLPVKIFNFMYINGFLHLAGYLYCHKDAQNVKQ